MTTAPASRAIGAGGGDEDEVCALQGGRRRRLVGDLGLSEANPLTGRPLGREELQFLDGKVALRGDLQEFETDDASSADDGDVELFLR
jgi:hypothetical protein